MHSAFLTRLYFNFPTGTARLPFVGLWRSPGTEQYVRITRESLPQAIAGEQAMTPDPARGCRIFPTYQRTSDGGHTLPPPATPSREGRSRPSPARQGLPKPEVRASQTELYPIKNPRGAHRPLCEYCETRDNDQFARDAWDRKRDDPGSDDEKPTSDKEDPFRTATLRPLPSLIGLLKSAPRRRALKLTPSLFQPLQHVHYPLASPCSIMITLATAIGKLPSRRAWVILISFTMLFPRNKIA